MSSSSLILPSRFNTQPQGHPRIDGASQLSRQLAVAILPHGSTYMDVPTGRIATLQTNGGTAAVPVTGGLSLTPGTAMPSGSVNTGGRSMKFTRALGTGPASNCVAFADAP